MDSKNNHRATSRVLDMLEIIADNSSGYTLTEICAIMDAPKSSIFPIIHTLANRGYLSSVTHGLRYTIGQMAFQVGNSYVGHFNILDEIQKMLLKIVDVCSETSFFGVLNGGDVLYLRKADSPEPIRMIAQVGKKLPAYSTGIGKALLVAHDLSMLHSLYPDGLVPLTKNTLKSIDDLNIQLQQIRESGFAYEIEESNDFVRCIAVPIYKHNHIVSAISVAIPVFRYNDKKAELIKNALQEAKKKLEALIKNTDIEFTEVI